MVIEDDEDTFEIDKHSHATNFMEVSEYVVWVREKLVEVEHAVKFGGRLAEDSYRKFLELLKDSIKKMGTWSPIEVADVEQVMKTVIDPKCNAWHKTMKGVKTRNCRTMMKVEEKREQILKMAEDKEIPVETSEVLEEDSLKGKTDKEQREIKLMIKRYFGHV